MKQIYNKILDFLNCISVDKYLHFIAGIIIASFFAIAIDFEYSIIPVFFAAALKEFIDNKTYGVWDWHDCYATIIGGLVIQLFQLI